MPIYKFKKHFKWAYFVCLILCGLTLVSCRSSDASEETYLLQIDIEPEEGGMAIPGSGSYTEGSEVEILAEANENWQFHQWSGDITSENNPITVTVNRDLTLTAEFMPVTYDLQITKVGDGSVEQELIQQKSEEYETGSVIQLTAVAAEGWFFSGWEGDLAGDENPATIEMNEDKEVTAVFKRQAFELTVSSTGEGTVTRELISGEETGDGILFESVVELSAFPDDGWEFISWSGDITSEDNPIQVEILDNLSIIAEFERMDYTLTIDVEGEGTVDMEVVQSKSTDFPFETEVELTAVADHGWQFTEWTGDVTGNANPAALIMDDHKTVTAWFDRREFSLDLQTEGNGRVSETLISGTEIGNGYLFESVVELEAIPDDSWEFVEWTGGVTGTENPVTLEIDQNLTVTAVFIPESATISTLTEGEGTISKTLISGTETAAGYALGSIIELEAVAETGWEFSSWSGDIGTTENPVQVEVTGDLEITAEFQIQAFNLNLQTSGNGTIEMELLSGETRGDQFIYLSEIELTAQADNDWLFTGWSGDLASTENPVVVVMDSNRSITANFDPFSNEYTVDLSFEDNRGNFDMQFGQSTDPESLRRLAPPPPPAGALNAYFRFDGTNYVRDYRMDTETDVTWELRYQAGDGTGLTLSWNLNPSEINGILLLKDEDEDETFEINMLEENSVDLRDGEDGVLWIRFVAK